MTRVLFEGDRAVGVEALVDGVPQALRADREVVLSAGAYNTPQLLMLSGIGPAEHLREHGLDVRVDRPAVGANLSDHANAGIIVRTGVESLMGASTAANAALLQTEGRGPLTSNIAEAGGFWRSRDGLDAPDVQFHMAPVMFAEEGLLEPTEDAWSVGACVLKPEGRGEVRLRSPDPTAKPRIVTRWLDGEGDWASMLAAQRLLLEIAAQPAIARHGTDPYQAPASDAEADLRAHVRAVAHCLYHPVGTCAIGGVVDAELRVEGVEGLRVADASVMPSVPRGNTNAGAIMIGEKAADLLAGRPAAAVAGTTVDLAGMPAGEPASLRERRPPSPSFVKEPHPHEGPLPQGARRHARRHRHRGGRRPRERGSGRRPRRQRQAHRHVHRRRVGQARGRRGREGRAQRRRHDDRRRRGQDDRGARAGRHRRGQHRRPLRRHRRRLHAARRAR